MASGDDDTFPTYAALTLTDGWATAAPVLSEIATHERSANRYVEGQTLGIGGIGKVVLCHDARIGRDVALKLLRTDRDIPAEERERFLREAQVQGQLEHPSIVPVYDIDRREDGTTFFTMRRVRGRTLHAILDDLRIGACKYSQRELLQAFGTICLTVDYAHSRGVIHRDLKPANLMLGDFGEVYVLDWGLARILDGSETRGLETASRLSMPGAMMGTPLYMAPEQMANPDVGPGADVYSLGAILFEILTYERVRDPRALFAPVEARPSLRAPDRNVAPELETVCVRATEMMVEDRFPSARALHDAVTSYLEGDRELEHRRSLAAGHAARAAVAMAEESTGQRGADVARSTAMRELVRALALEPTNRAYVAMLAEILNAAPRVVPPEVEAKLEADAQLMIRGGANYTGVALFAWLFFLPLILAVGVRRIDFMLYIVIPALAAGGLALTIARRPKIGAPIQVLVLAIMMVATAAVSRLFGPLILVPTILTPLGIVIQGHPQRTVRIAGMALTASALVVPILLELIGALPSSYEFSADGFTVLPQMTALPHWFVLAFIGIANVSIAVMPAVFVARLRAALARAHTREQVRSWHLARLGDDLLSAAE